MKHIPKEAVDVFEPLGDEVVGDGLGVVGEAQILKRVEEQWRAVIECGNGHLQTHGPQLAGLYFTYQTLQSGRYKQGHHLQGTGTKIDLFITFSLLPVWSNPRNEHFNTYSSVVIKLVGFSLSV